MKFILSFALTIVSIAVAIAANANTIAISNVPGTGSYNKPKALSPVAWEAVGMTTDATSQDFVSLVGVFAGGTTGGTLEGGIFSDNGLNKPSTQLMAFNNVPVAPFTTAQFTITTTSNFHFLPSTKYWFVLHDAIPFAWMGDNAVNGTTPGVTPGYNYNGFASTADSGTTWLADSVNYTAQISTIPVPEPSTLALTLAGALGMVLIARRLR